MTDPVLSAAEIAAIPTAIAVLKALQQFNANMGIDPMQWALKFPGAFDILLGTIKLQVPSLAQAEGGAIIGEANTKISSWISSLQAKEGTPAA
jgi:hypothetical protein